MWLINHRYYFSSLRGWKFKIRVPAWLCSHRVSSGSQLTVFLLCLHSAESKIKQDLVSLYRGTNPLMRAPSSWHSNFTKGLLPDTITLWFRISNMQVLGTHLSVQYNNTWIQQRQKHSVLVFLGLSLMGFNSSFYYYYSAKYPNWMINYMIMLKLKNIALEIRTFSI